MQRTDEPSGSITSSRLDAIKRLRLPRRSRAQSYRTIDGLNADRDAVPWYWRLLAVGATFMILGGFLMLPATFDHDPDLRLSRTGIGIFGVAILAAGLSFTGLLTFAVQNPLFQADGIFLPSLTSCAVGLLTVCYDFIVSSRYEWNIPAILIIVAAGVSTVTYAGLLIWTYRRISVVRTRSPGNGRIVPLRETSVASSSINNLWQDPGYYENYIRNMFPTSAHPIQTQETSYNHAQTSLSEEEMQRQQMLMLLFAKDQPSPSDPSSSTFHIDWQGQEQEDGPPAQGYYAPGMTNSSVSTVTSTGFPRTGTNQTLQPWDGVWRGVAPMQNSDPRATNQNRREERRRQIESGR